MLPAARRALLLNCVAAAAGTIFIFTGLAPALAGGPLFTMPLLLVLLGSALVVGWRYWRAGVVLLLIVVCFEGLLYRSVAGDARVAVLFLKAFLAFVVYLGFWSDRRSRGLPVWRHRALLWPAGVLLGISIVQMLNPEVSSLMTGVVALGIFWGFMPLLEIGYCFAESRAQLTALLLLLAVASLLVCGAGIAQARLGPSSFEGTLLDYSKENMYGGVGISGRNYYRPPATFTFNGQFGHFVVWAVPVLVGLVGAVRAPLARALAFTSAAVAVLALAIQGARSPVVVATLGMLLVLFNLCLRGRQRLAVLLLVLPLLAVPFVLAGDELADRQGTISRELGGRVERSMFFWLDRMDAGALIGHGLGTATAQARYFVTTELFFPEVFWVQIFYELGIAGLVAFLWLWATLLRLVVRSRAPTGDTRLLWLWSGLFGFSISALIYTLQGGFYQTPVNVFLWFFTGLTLRASDLDQPVESPVPQRIPALSPLPPRPRLPAGSLPPGRV